MKKLFFFFLLFPTILFSQVKFYVKPTIENKIHVSNNGLRGSNVRQFNNRYLAHEYNRLNYNGFLNLDLGLAIGVQWKNNHFFEFIYSQDRIGLGSKTSYNVMPLINNSNENLYISNHMSSKISFYTNRFMLSYQYTFFKTRNNFLSIRLITALGLGFNSQVRNHRSYVMKIDETYNGYFPLSPTASLEGRKSYSWQNKKVFGYTQLGLGFDFNLKRRHLFALDILYTQGFKGVMYETVTYVVMDDGQKYEYSFSGHSKGSGINIQLSRRFQLYPWIKTKKKEGREIEKF